jgi:ABC-2 type transport system permease protein
VVPIAIASFFGSIFGGSGSTDAPRRMNIAIVDQDNSAISKGILAGAQGDTSLNVSTPSADEARAQVTRGDMPVAVIIPPGFGQAAGTAFFGNAGKPALDFLYDPSNSLELGMARGIMTQHVFQAVSKEMFSGQQGQQFITQTLPQIEASTTMSDDQKRALTDMLKSVQSFYGQQTAQGQTASAGPGFSLPYTVNEQPMTAGANALYNGYAHSFAGMGIQFLLFAAANLGVEILLERQKGLWRRLRSAPVSRFALLAGKGISMSIIAVSTLLVSFAFAMIVFRVRIHGSLIGFLAVSAACAIMAAAFGLLIAALGKTPAATRGVTTLAVLMMVMLGGAWVPSFIFPQWLQRVTVVVPARWAVDGLDAMTWRGMGLGGAVMPTMMLLAFAGLFGTIALLRFRWEEI